MARRRGRPKSANMDKLHALFITELYPILCGLRVSPQHRTSYLKLWFDGDLKRTHRACKKLVNITASMLEERKNKKKEAVDAQLDKMRNYFGV